MKKSSGRKLLLTILCSTVALTMAGVAAEDAALAQSGISEPHAAEWRAAVERLEDAYKKSGDGALPDDDPQMREDFLTMAKLDPAETLQFLTLHPLKSDMWISGFVRYTLKFYIPGFQEIGRTSPDLLADWLTGLDENSLHSSNVFSDGALVLANRPDALSKLFAKRSYNSGYLIGFIPRDWMRREFRRLIWRIAIGIPNVFRLLTWIAF